MPRLQAYQEYSEEFDIQMCEKDDEIKEEEKLEKLRNDRKDESLKRNKEILTLEDFQKLKLPEVEFEQEDPEVV